MCYFCKPCGTYVGCHNNTRKPLGTMADQELVELRKKAHSIIDPLWKKEGMKRKDVYIMLNQIFGKEIHVGKTDKELCNLIISKLGDSVLNNKI